MRRCRKSAGSGVVVACLAAVVAYGMFASSVGAQSAAGKTGPLENTIYKAPPGWQEAAPNATTRTFLSQENGQQALIILMRGPRFQGDFKQAFAAAVQAAQQGNKIVQQTAISEEPAAEDYTVLTQAMVYDDKDGKRGWSEYVAADPDQHLVFIGFIASAQDLFVKDAAVLQQFLKDLTFTDVKPAAATGTRADAAGTRADAIGNQPSTTSDGTTIIKLGHGTGGVWAKKPEAIYAAEQQRRVPGKVTGKVYDAQGRPFRLAGCEVLIHVWGVTANGERTFFDGQADADGRYEIPVAHGLYAVNCTAKMPLGGQVLAVDLEVLDGRRPSLKEDSTPGIVKDFGLKLTGPVFDGRPGDYHGGSIVVTDGPGYHSLFDALDRRYPPGTTVQVLLIPRGAFIDGTPGQPIRLDCDLQKMKTGQTLVDFPLGLYTVAARLVTPDGKTRDLKVGGFPGEQYAATVDIAFVPQAELNGRPSVPNICVTD